MYLCICVFERKEAEGNLRLASLKRGSLKGEDLGSPIAICIDDANDNGYGETKLCSSGRLD